MKYWLLLLLGWPLLVEAQHVGPAEAIATNQPFAVGMLPPIQLNSTPNWTKPLDIASHSLFYDDLSGLPEPFPVIRRHGFLPFAQKQQTYRNPPQSKVSTIVTWLAFRVQNTSPTQSAETLLDVGGHGKIDLYTDRGVHVQQTGIYFLPYNVEQWEPIRLQVGPLQTKTFFVKITDLVRVVSPIMPMLHTPLSLKLMIANRSHLMRWLFLSMAMIAAGLFIMSLFAATQYYFNRDLVFLYYTIFCFAASFSVVWNMNFALGLGLPLQMRSTNQPFSFIISFFYILFVARFIDLPIYSSKTWSLLRALLVVFAIQEVLAIYEYGNGLIFMANWYYLGQELPFLVAGIVVFIALLRSKSPFRGYLLIGIICLWLISYFVLFLDVRIMTGNSSIQVFARFLPFFFSLGMLFESFFFLLALAYRNRLVEVEKNQMQGRYTQQLEEQLTIRTQEIETKNQLLEDRRILQLQTEFEHKLADTEMTALRAQMNPHFIFNCLNSIKLYTLQNDTDKASDYLTKFSRLIRLVLENSRADRISLQNELEALQLYSDLEAMRFKQKVRVSIRVDPDIDQQEATIPPLLLQPYVENAIWHGLMHKMEGGTVTVEVTQSTDTYLHVEVTDDGVGRARAGELKSKSAGNHKSFGMQVTADRIRMINELYNTQTQAQIFDLVAPNGEPLGTKVVLDIPV
jgi:sensor histidine kinase YesM